jgi:glutamate N-acetyltransferase/amino-acid N-acetyltransferase
VKSFDKAFSVIRELASSTIWPEKVKPALPEDFTAREFWPQGFTSSGINSGIKTERKDLMLICSSVPASSAALFTTNLCCAAPVELSRKHMGVSASSIRAVICNSGNANAATGHRGLQDAYRMAADTAGEFGFRPEEVLVASTGVIGQKLPAEKITAAMPALKKHCGEHQWTDAAEAIMTTDTFPKFFAVDVMLSSGRVRISGIAKGSGMICPDMATMLAFVATDAGIAPAMLQTALVEANRHSFNAITVDGDTSTNDMVAVLANGAGPAVITGTGDYELFVLALKSVMVQLAKLIVIDGEGATKFVEIRVNGARNDHDAGLAARTIANSSLVKTAIHGEDANWGRIIAAAGRSGAEFEQESLQVFFDDLPILKPGFIADFSEEEAKKIMSRDSFVITVCMGDGPGSAVIWTCDLSKRYIEINGSYRS